MLVVEHKGGPLYDNIDSGWRGTTVDALLALTGRRCVRLMAPGLAGAGQAGKSRT